MKTVVFSDVHGNIQALKAMLQQAEDFGAEQYIFCGDILGYFLHQEEVIWHLQQLSNLYAVLGNHDSYYLNTACGGRARADLAGKYGRSYLKEIGSSGWEYLKSLPQAVELELEEKKIFVAHGSLEQYLEGRIYPDTKVDAALYGRYDLVILGHTHYRMHRVIHNTVLLNPGSLGQPRDGRGYSYCLMDIGADEFIFQRVAIDEKKLLNELRLSGEDGRLVKYLESRMEGVS